MNRFHWEQLCERPVGAKANFRATSPLVPVQRVAKRRFKVRVNHHEQWMLKHAVACSGFHSVWELCFAALLESDPGVTRYVPQPFMICVGGRARRYVPDFWLADQSGNEWVIEVAAQKRLDTPKTRAESAHFASLGYPYLLAAHEEIAKHSIRAENWLYIIRVIRSMAKIDLTRPRHQLLEYLASGNELSLAECESYLHGVRSEVALAAAFGLLHQGQAVADLDGQRISRATRLRTA